MLWHCEANVLEEKDFKMWQSSSRRVEEQWTHFIALSVILWHPRILRDLRNPTHLRDMFSTTAPCKQRYADRNDEPWEAEAEEEGSSAHRRIHPPRHLFGNWTNPPSASCFHLKPEYSSTVRLVRIGTESPRPCRRKYWKEWNPDEEDTSAELAWNHSASCHAIGRRSVRPNQCRRWYSPQK